jgi:hypothetical protein
MADVRITPAISSIQFTGSVAGDVLDLIYTGSALQFNTGSTNLIHISSSGFIGFGTTVPLPYNTSSFVVNSNTLLAQGLVVGAPGFFDNGLIEFYESQFSIAANNVIGLNSFNISGVPAIGIRYNNGYVGIGTGTYPPAARLHVSGGNAWFNDDVIVGLGNYPAGGKVKFVDDSGFMYVGGDINTQTTTLYSATGPVELTNNFGTDTFQLNNGIRYSRSGVNFFTATADEFTFNQSQATFAITPQGTFNLGVQLGQKVNIVALYESGMGWTNWFSIDPQNGFDIYTGSVQLLGIKPNGDVEIGSATNPNSVLYVTGSINVSGSILTTGSLEVSGSINTTGSINVAGNIYTNGTNIQSLSIAYAIALG